MSNIQYQCTLTTPFMEPLYKTYSGLMLTIIELSTDITENVRAMRFFDIHILDYKQPTIDELYDCWMYGKELVYTIECEDSQFNVEFRITPKYS